MQITYLMIKNCQAQVQSLKSKVPKSRPKGLGLTLKSHINIRCTWSWCMMSLVNGQMDKFQHTKTVGDREFAVPGFIIKVTHGTADAFFFFPHISTNKKIIIQHHQIIFPFPSTIRLSFLWDSHWWWHNFVSNSQISCYLTFFYGNPS